MPASQISDLKISDRGEYEISHVNQQYVDDDNYTFNLLKGWWTDAGTFKSYRNANELLWRLEDERS